MSKISRPSLLFSLTVTVGFAIFAMFFGAGNLVFPIQIGAQAGEHLNFAVIGFFISGIIIPLLGLYVIALYHGNYMHFFSSLGRVPGFLVVSVVLALIGLVVGTPRCSLLSYNTFLPLFPKLSGYRLPFNALFFLSVYLISIKQNRVVDALGWVISPLKLFVLFILIVFGVAATRHELLSPPAYTYFGVFKEAVIAGYSTMDLLAGFFFCAFVHRAIQYKLSHKHDINNDRFERKITLLGSILGAVLLAIVYGCFILIANFHAGALEGVATQNLIGKLSVLLLHDAGGIFVAICVSLACFSAAVAVNAVTVEFIHTHVFRHRISYRLILPIVTFIVFVVSNLGFARLMALAVPILTILYPALLGLTIGNIFYKLKGWKIGAPLFYLIFVISVAQVVFSKIF